MNHKINKLLIANRAEIALRIKSAADKVGIPSAIVVSEADRNQSYVKAFGSEVAYLPGSNAKDTYLNSALILAAADSLGCNAIHPGYGFLSEDATFANAVEDHGLIFVGPRSQTIELLGSKTSARELAKKIGVPIVAGTPGGLSNEQLIAAAKKQKFPLLIKATAGGGGRGMRIVHDLSQLEPELQRARAEALKFFSNDDVFIERYIENPRHIEVQLFGDNSGQVVHFGTRDCTAQRRYQKLIEEAPAPFLSPAIRKKIESAAVRLAKKAKYQNAGTAEFIVKGSEFFFLEINTRIQVEHPVTEIAYGVDLVELQLQVAQGKKIPQKYINKKPVRYAIEGRVYAEKSPGFIPSIGDIEFVEVPCQNESTRIDFGFKSGDVISPYYDAMIGKVIVSGTNRTSIIDKFYHVLQQVQVEGVDVNIATLQKISQLDSFKKGTLSIQDIDKLSDAWYLSPIEAPGENSRKMEGSSYLLQPNVEIQSYPYRAKKNGETFDLFIEYRNSYFVVIPYLGGKAPKSKKVARRSKERDQAISAVCQDVLEGLSRQEIRKIYGVY